MYNIFADMLGVLNSLGIIIHPKFAMSKKKKKVSISVIFLTYLNKK